ncbi:retrotransposon protein, putative, unclassified, expressed [Cucumis melo var. makuwa]|uniref:Retrotransposon protein, putative, unclassified, expressed n=1 Tax=Cucumis melo var. makuwa TaxID=1194695 RepID=A0A5D3D5R3_CUCMM|nr:retrotransposon protein, putative, unclassified, expressed [Cucumis melo var. makuwa]
MGQLSPPSSQKALHAPPLSGVWAHAPPSVNLTAHPIHFYASSPVQPSYPSDHPPLHAPPIAAGQQPSKLSNLYSSANLFVDPLQQPFFYRNGADQHHNRSGIEEGESLAPSGYGQPYVRGLRINQTYRRAVFEVSTSLAQTNLPMYSKNPVILLPNMPSNYITNFVAFSARSLTHDNGKPILVCEHCKKQRHTKDQCWKLHGWPPRGNKRSSNEQQNSGRTNVREIASTFQPIGPIANSRATDHLTGFSEHFISYTPYAGNEKIRIADGSLASIARKGQIVLFDGFFLQNVLHVPKLSYNLLSISKITRELHCKATFLPEFMSPHYLVMYAFGQNHIVFLFPHHHINPYNRLPLSIVTCPSKVTTSSRKRWFVTFIDDHTRLTWVYLITDKSENVFGCTTYVHSFGPNQTKFIPRTQACVFVGYPPHRRSYKCFHSPSRKYFVTMDVTFCEDRPYFPISHLQGESVSEKSNSTFEFIKPTPSTVSDIDLHPIILPTNQVPWKTYYRRNLRKEVGSLTSQPLAPVQDSKPLRDQGMENPTEPCTNNTMNENDRSDVAVLENVEEKNSSDETEVRTETSNNEVEQGHTGKLDKYDPSLDLPIALRKDGTLDRHKARVLLSVAVNKDWFLYQLDVKNAFLNGDLVEEVYMRTLSGFVAQFSEQAEINQLKQRMGNEFEIKDLRNLKYFLGMEVARSKEGIFVSQRKYTLDLLTETGMLGCPTETPIEFNCKLGNSNDQFMQAPYEEHMEAVKRILRYLKTTPGKGLMFRKTDKKTIEAYTDSDWAGSVVDRKSTSDYCTFVWDNLVIWRSKKQSVVPNIEL